MSLEFLSDKVCVIPEGGAPEEGARKLFPGARIVPPESDKSEGMWFIAFKEPAQSNEVRIFDIAQTKFRWNVDENSIYRDLIMCPAKIEIDLSADIPTIKQFFTK